MKPFNLKEAKAGKPVCTRDGRPARIICFDKKSNIYPLIALVDYGGEGEMMFTFTKKGEFHNKMEDPCDLFMVSEEHHGKHEGWVNIFRRDDGTIKLGNLYDSEQEAINNANQKRIATIKIEWEE